MSIQNSGFHYVIAKPWRKDSKSLKTYALGTEVFWGNEQEAITTRNLIRGRSQETDYEIYLISPTPFKPSR